MRTGRRSQPRGQHQGRTAPTAAPSWHDRQAGIPAAGRGANNLNDRQDTTHPVASIATVEQRSAPLIRSPTASGRAGTLALRSSVPESKGRKHDLTLDQLKPQTLTIWPAAGQPRIMRFVVHGPPIRRLPRLGSVDTPCGYENGRLLSGHSNTCSICPGLADATRLCVPKFPRRPH